MIYLELFLTFFKIGLFTFGGGYAMLPLIQEEVTARGWMEMQQLIDFIAVSESTPGPFAVNIATYVGAELAGVVGSVCATLGVVSPSFIVILIVARIYDKFRESRTVKGMMTGLKPAVIGLIGAAVLSMAATVFFSGGISLQVLSDGWFYVSVVIFVLCLIAVLRKLPPILVICLSAVLGIGAGYALELLQGA